MDASPTYHKMLPHHPLQNLLNLSMSPTKLRTPKEKAFFSKPSAFPDKALQKALNGRPKVILREKEEVKPASRPQTTRMMTSPDRKSITKLLNVESPYKNKSPMNPLASKGGKVQDLYIYTELKSNCRDIIARNSFESKALQTVKLHKLSPKVTLLKQLQQEYYRLQKKSIENYLKGERVNNQLIEMDFFAFTKLKKARLLEYISELETKRDQTPIDQIISQKKQASLLRAPKRVSRQQKASSEKHLKQLEFLNELIEKQTQTQNMFDSKKDQIMNKMELYNQYYMNYFTPPSNPDKLFTSLKDLSISRFSLSKDLMNKAPTIIESPVCMPYSRLRTQKTSKDLSHKESKDLVRKESREIPSGATSGLLKTGARQKELVGAGVMENMRRRFEEQNIEYVKTECQQLKDWKREMDDKRELEIEERDFLKAVKSGDLKKVSFYLIDNKGFVHIRDQIRQTPLHWAAKRGFLDVAKLLLEKGADLNAIDMVSRTPKQLAYVNGNKEVFGFLQGQEEFIKRQDEFKKITMKPKSGFRPDSVKQNPKDGKNTGDNELL